MPLGQTARTAVAAEGEGLTYQWYGINPDGTEFKSSIRGRSYSVTMVTAKIGRQVWCVVTDKNGNSVTTRTATLGATLPEDYVEPSITQDAVHCLVEPGEKATVTIAATGCGPLTYQWYYRNPGDAGWSKSSIRTPTYSCLMNTARDGRQIRCVVTDAYAHSVTSSSAVIGFNYPAGYAFPTITRQPQSVSVCMGKTARVSFEAAGTDLTYQWYLRSSPGAAWSRSSLTGSSYSITLVPSKAGRQVKCVVTDRFGNTAETAVATLDMIGPVILTQPQDVTVANGEKAATTVAVEGEGLTYQWYLRDPGKTAWSRSSLKTDTYSVKMIPSKSGRQVKCVVTDQYGSSVTSAVATLNMAS